MVSKLRNRLALALAIPALAVALATVMPSLTADAWWPAGWSGSATLYAFTWNHLYPIALPWTASSNLGYDEVVDSTGEYTVVETLTHQLQTSTNWTQFQGDFAGSTTTTLQDNGSAVRVFGLAYGDTHLNGSCAGPVWNFYFCASGTNTQYHHFYNGGDASVYSELDMNGDGWEGTSHMNGSYSWSY